VIADRRHRVALAVAVVGVIALSFALRLPGLEDKPLHSDEGVNGWFTLRLYWWNVYRYQPSDYHGPFLYYVNLVFFWLLGPTDRALRMGTVFAGSLAVLALLPARRWMGAAGVAVFGLLMACAPAMVYFSRTNIHEVYLVAFTLLWASALLRFAEAPSIRWGAVAGLACVLCFANKETAILTTGCLGLAAAAAWALGRASTDPRDPDLFGGRSRLVSLRAWTTGQPWAWAAGVAVFAAVMVLLFSSVFSYWYGVGGFFRAFTPWLEHGSTGRNQGKPFGYFLDVMTVSEGLALYAAVVPALWALARRHRVGIGLTVWAASAFLVYSSIPYKTPWCVLNIDLPVFLLCGWGAGQASLLLFDAGRPRALRALAALGLVLPLVALPGLLRETLDANTDAYDDADRSYVYVQTQRGFFDMISDHLGVGAEAADDGLGARVINVDAKNPARWYLITRGWDHDRVAYPSRAPAAEDLEDVDIVVAAGKQTRKTAKAVEAEGGEWHLETYPLRPGWTLSAWYRQPLWDAYQAAGGRASRAWPVAEVEAPHRPPKPKRYRRKGEG
jgi:uncharacterized protein (TIGR03663 family)